MSSKAPKILTSKAIRKKDAEPATNASSESHRMNELNSEFEKQEIQLAEIVRHRKGMRYDRSIIEDYS